MDRSDNRSPEDLIDAPTNIDPQITEWRFFGRHIPRSEVVYFSQVVIIYVVILSCVVNLSIHDQRADLWIALLSSCLGFLMPAPKL